MDIETLIGRKTHTALEINGIFVPANSAIDVLRGFTDPALFYNSEFPEYEFSQRGTLTKLRHNKSFFVAVTKHQTKDFDFDQLVLQGASAKKFRSSESVIRADHRDFGEDEFDLRLFDFSRSVEEGHLSQSGWLDIGRFDETPKANETDVVVAFGFPCSECDLDYEGKKITSTSAFVYGKHTTSAVRNRHSFAVHDRPEFPPDGMSGGPVFSFGVDGTEPRVRFCGVTSNASKSRFNYIPFSTLRRMSSAL